MNDIINIIIIINSTYRAQNLPKNSERKIYIYIWYKKYISNDHIVKYTGWPKWRPHISLTMLYIQLGGHWVTDSNLYLKTHPENTVLSGRFTSVLIKILFRISRVYQKMKTVRIHYTLWYKLRTPCIIPDFVADSVSL